MYAACFAATVSAASNQESDDQFGAAAPAAQAESKASHKIEITEVDFKAAQDQLQSSAPENLTDFMVMRFSGDAKRQKAIQAAIKELFLTSDLREFSAGTDVVSMLNKEHFDSKKLKQDNATAIQTAFNTYESTIRHNAEVVYKAREIAMARIAEEQAEAERKAQAEADRLASEAAEEQAEAERKAQAEADRLAAEAAEAERKAAEEQAEADRLAAEAAEAERKAAAEQAEVDRLAEEQAEAERKAAAEQAEVDRLAEEQADADADGKQSSETTTAGAGAHLPNNPSKDLTLIPSVPAQVAALNASGTTAAGTSTGTSGAAPQGDSSGLGDDEADAKAQASITQLSQEPDFITENWAGQITGGLNAAFKNKVNMADLKELIEMYFAGVINEGNLDKAIHGITASANAGVKNQVPSLLASIKALKVSKNSQ